MKKSFAPEHGSELFRDAFKELLNRRRVTDESGCHFQPPRWNITDGCLDIIRNPVHEEAAVLILNIHHLLINFLKWFHNVFISQFTYLKKYLHRHASSEDRGNRQITSMTRITSSHHVLRVKHLLRELRHWKSSVLLRSTRCQRRKARHEEVQAREWDHVDS